MRRVAIFLVLQLLLWSTPATAEICVQPTVRTTSIHFGNGILNTWDSANAGLKALQHAIEMEGIKPSGGEIFSYVLSYNRSEIRDPSTDLKGIDASHELLQLGVQAVGHYTGAIWGWLAGDVMPESFATALESLTERSHYLSDPDFAYHLDQYRTRIDSGGRVLLVAHSQGNFYAIQAYNALYGGYSTIPEGTFAYMAIATPLTEAPLSPVTQLLENERYSLLTGDWIIPPLLPANVTNNSKTFSGHEFVKDYIAGDRSGPKILRNISSALAEMKWPQICEESPSNTFHRLYPSLSETVFADWEPSGIALLTGQHGDEFFRLDYLSPLGEPVAHANVLPVPYFGKKEMIQVHTASGGKGVLLGGFKYLSDETGEPIYAPALSWRGIPEEMTIAAWDIIVPQCTGFSSVEVLSDGSFGVETRCEERKSQVVISPNGEFLEIRPLSEPVYFPVADLHWESPSGGTLVCSSVRLSDGRHDLITKFYSENGQQIWEKIHPRMGKTWIAATYEPDSVVLLTDDSTGVEGYASWRMLILDLKEGAVRSNNEVSIGFPSYMSTTRAGEVLIASHYGDLGTSLEVFSVDGTSVSKWNGSYRNFGIEKNPGGYFVFGDYAETTYANSQPPSLMVTDGYGKEP